MSAHAETAARLERLRGFLEADPKNVALLAESADVALQLGLARDAHGWLERALTEAPRNASLLSQLASAKLALGEVERALELLEPLVRAHPGEPALLYNYGYALLRAGRYAESRDALAPIAEQPDAPPNARPLLVRALHYLGELDEALEVALRHAAAHPGDAAAAGMLGLLYLDKANWAEARRWSQQSLEGAPRNLDALLAAGTVALADEKGGRRLPCSAPPLKRRPKVPAPGRASAPRR